MDYEIYILDDLNHVKAAHDFVDYDDLDALGEARSFTSIGPVVVWQRERLVARVPIAGIDTR